MKSLTALCFFLFLGGVAVFLGQMWAHFLAPEIIY